MVWRNYTTYCSATYNISLSTVDTNSAPSLSMLVERTVKNSVSLGLLLKVSVVTARWWLLVVRGSVEIQLRAEEEKRENSRLVCAAGERGGGERGRG